jgi:hypothetical protein
MAFITGSMTNSDPGTALFNLIEAQALATGWTLHDTIDYSNTRFKVFKSAAAGNTLNKDWYLIVRFPITGTSGGFSITPSEGWDAPTHKVIRGPLVMDYLNNPIEQTYYSYYGNTTRDPNTGDFLCASTFTSLRFGLITTSFGYYISITRDRIIMLLTSSPGALLYAGFFTPTADHAAHAGSALYPLVAAVLQPDTEGYSGGNASATAGLTRIPKVAAFSGSSHWGLTCRIIAGGSLKWFNNGLLGGAVSPYTGKISGSGLLVTSCYDGASFHWLGTIDDVINVHSYSATRGDSATIGSDTWYATNVQSSKVLMMRAV